VTPIVPVLSILLVSLDCRRVVSGCLDSLRRSSFRDYEIVCVDNGSDDDTVEYLRAQPDVRLIENGANRGFTKAMNQAIAASSGKYLLWLNTDTIVRETSLAKLVEFLDAHPRAGIVGPRVLNPDGSLQAQCRRGMPTPFAALSYALRLDRVWPNHRRVSRYLMRWLPEHQAAQVDAVSGCCLLTRREVHEQIGVLDESMFAFGEDIDWCVRAAAAGWEVWYYPGSVITHLKGQGGAHTRPYRKIFGLHQAMWLVYRKHLSARYGHLTTAAVAAGVGVSLIVAAATKFVSRLPRRRQPA